jgi:L-asparaginase
MRILVIYAGGTIGQVAVPGESYTRPPESSEEFEKALSRIVGSFPEHAFTFEFYSSKESSNMQPEDWENLANSVYQHQGDFDGIIIAHGTDTMTYTANAIALGLFNMELNESELLVPVIITGAQVELFRPNSDGDDNLANAIIAVDLMANNNVADVMIIFGRELILGSAALKISETELDAFSSPGVATIARATSQGIRIYNPIVARVPEAKNRLILRQLYHSKRGANAPSAKFLLNLPPSDATDAGSHSSSIVFLSFQPGMHPSVLRKAVDDPATLAVVIRSLGAGNIATQGRGLLECVQYAVEEYNLPILIASSFPGGNTAFNKDESGNIAVRSGAVQVGSHTEASIVVKLHWLLANGSVEDLPGLVRYMQSSFVGELDGAHAEINKTPSILPIHQLAPRNRSLSFIERIKRLP